MSEKKYCTQCGAEIRPQASVCLKCGCPASGSKNFCSYCGEKLNPKQVICLKCGANVSPIPVHSNDIQLSGTRNKIVAALLAFCLGGLGVHKFYLGQPIKGIFYLLFCWTCIPAIIALIEGIVYLTMGNQEFNQKYNVEE